ncbi:MAG: zeta toxin family protein [Rhodoferax sp.]|nr:zeta toxin family protein [Rhodoferax sp.]MCB2035323.1 zeta toxin family protein [Ottowia sp.]
MAAITSSYFAQRAARSSAQDQPRVVLVGGQPGAGKSAGGELVRDELKAQGGFVHVDADRMRERIPLGTARLPSSETQADAGRLANALRLMAIEARRNIVEEGTFRNPQSVQRFVDRLQEQGYKVEMVVVATSREESLLGIYQRHERQHQVGNPNPRFVTEDYHDAAMQGFSATVSQLAHQLDRLRIINRGGQLLYDSQRQPRDDATMALQAAREIPAERRTMLADGWAAVAAAARERGANPQYLDAIGGHARRVAASAQLQGDRGARITPYTRGKEQALSRGASPAGPFTSLAATPQASKPPARSR